MPRAVTDEILTHLNISGLLPVVLVAQPFQTICERILVSRAVINEIVTADNVNFNSCRSDKSEISAYWRSYTRT